MSDPVLYRWPATAAFGRVVPKTKFYARGNIGAGLRERFVEDVHRITWSFKLADDTIRLRGTSAVPEIQVFTVETKGADVADQVLTAIDKTVRFPIVFEVVSGERVRTVAALKTIAGKVPAIKAYFTTDWQSSDASRQPLPTALDLPSLYEALLASLVPAPLRAGERVSQATDRLERARKLRREITALEKKVRNEPQLNRKIEFRRQLRERADALNELTDPATSKKD